jgi:hypothetical protein
MVLLIDAIELNSGELGNAVASTPGRRVAGVMRIMHTGLT